MAERDFHFKLAWKILLFKSISYSKVVSLSLLFSSLFYVEKDYLDISTEHRNLNSQIYPRIEYEYRRFDFIFNAKMYIVGLEPHKFSFAE